ncbi:hypothetical protein C8R45DRAFT_1072658 [Mycena sanguinolenta]|nr:hypothetical protein C8R45DRAFT_1072658 [Mycena sanguinolenta]
MQYRILIAFVVSCFTLSVAAAPIADSSILDPTPEVVKIERAPQPEPGCRLYTCVCSIAVMDEATNSVDFASDLEILKAIREELTGSRSITATVQTTIGSPRRVILDHGQFAEFETPA